MDKKYNPIAIVVAGVIVAGAIVYTQANSGVYDLPPVPPNFNYDSDAYGNGEYYEGGDYLANAIQIDGKLRRIDNIYDIELETDGTKVYYYGNEVSADLKTLQDVSDRLFKDKYHLFFVHNMKAEKVNGIDPSHFESIYFGDNDNQRFYTDGSAFYFTTDDNFLQLPVKNPKLLQNSLYIKGDDKVYYAMSSMPYADPATFKLVTRNSTNPRNEDYTFNYAEDEKGVYYKDKRIEGADPASFKVFPSSYYQEYAYDNTHVYIDGDVIDGADPLTFVVLKDQPYEGCGTGEYSKDAKAVYYKNKKIAGADPSTFKVRINGYAYDAHSSYFNGLQIPLSTKEIDDIECDFG